MQVSLTMDGAKGVAKDGGTKRRQAAEQFFKSAGGKLRRCILLSVIPMFSR
jgi:uncharacterized protein with GYD domain